MYLVRDRIGIKPLYYTINKNFKIIFSSEQLPLVKSGLCEIKADWNGLVSGMLFRGSLRPNTVYKGIKSVSPGSYVCISEIN